MLWILLSVLGGLGDATIYAFMKKLQNVDKILLVWVQHAFALPFIFLLLYFNFPSSINNNVYWLGAVNAVLLSVTTYLLAKAAQLSKLSISMPMLSMTPLFLLLTSYLMINEIPTFFGVIGVFLIVIGAYAIHLRRYQKGFLTPIISLVKNKGSVLVLIAAFIMSIMANIFKIGILNSNVFYFSFVVYGFVSLFILPLMFIQLNKKISQLRNSFKSFLMLGASSTFMNITAGLAMAVAIVPYVIALKRSSVIFSILYGNFLFGEKNVFYALIGTSIMIIGGVLITLS